MKQKNELGNCLITLNMHVANVLMGCRLIWRGGEVRCQKISIYVNILISSKYICDQVVANSFIQKLSNS